MEANKNQTPLEPNGKNLASNQDMAEQPPANIVNTHQRQADMHNRWNSRRDYANSWVNARGSHQPNPSTSPALNQPTTSFDSQEEQDEDFDMPELDNSPLVNMPVQPAIEPKYSLKKLNRYLPRKNKAAQSPSEPDQQQPYQVPKIVKLSNNSPNDDYLPLISLAMAFGAPLGGLIIAIVAFKKAKQKDEPIGLIILSFVANSFVLATFIFFIYLVLSRKI